MPKEKKSKSLSKMTTPELMGEAQKVMKVVSKNLNELNATARKLAMAFGVPKKKLPKLYIVRNHFSPEDERKAYDAKTR